MGFLDRFKSAGEKAKQALNEAQETVAEKSEKFRKDAKAGLDAVKDRAQDAVAAGKEIIEDLRKNS